MHSLIGTTLIYFVYKAKIYTIKAILLNGPTCNQASCVVYGSPIAQYSYHSKIRILNDIQYREYPYHS